MNFSPNASYKSVVNKKRYQTSSIYCIYTIHTMYEMSRSDQDSRNCNKHIKLRRLRVNKVVCTIHIEKTERLCEIEMVKMQRLVDVYQVIIIITECLSQWIGFVLKLMSSATNYRCIVLGESRKQAKSCTIIRQKNKTQKTPLNVLWNIWTTLYMYCIYIYFPASSTYYLVLAATYGRFCYTDNSVSDVN